MSFTYDPNEVALRDVIRGLAGDTADPGILADETYDAILLRYGATAMDTAPYFRAAAESLRRVAIAIEQQPTSVAAQGDGSVGWSASRTTSLRALASELDAKADAIDAASGGWGSVVTVKSDFLTGGKGAPTW